MAELGVAQTHLGSSFDNNSTTTKFGGFAVIFCVFDMAKVLAKLPSPC